MVKKLSSKKSRTKSKNNHTKKAKEKEILPEQGSTLRPSKNICGFTFSLTVRLDKGRHFPIEEHTYTNVLSYDVAPPFFQVCEKDIQHYLPMCWIIGVRVGENGLEWEKKHGWVD